MLWFSVLTRYFFQTIFSEFILKLGQGLCSPAHEKTCHNKAGGVRGDTGGVSLTDRAGLLYSALIGRPNVSTVKTGTIFVEWACLQTERLGGWRGMVAHMRTRTSTHSVVVKLRV